MKTRASESFRRRAAGELRTAGRRQWRRIGCMLILVLFGAIPTAAATPDAEEMRRLRTELAAIEEAFDRIESDFWQVYFMPRNNKERTNLINELRLLERRCRDYKPIFAQNCRDATPPPGFDKRLLDLELPVIPILRVLQDQKLAKINWRPRPNSLKLSSRSAIPADDPLKYLYRCNNAMNHNLKYAFHCTNIRCDCSGNNDCRAHRIFLERPKNKTARSAFNDNCADIALLDQVLSEYFLSVRDMRRSIIAVEHALNATENPASAPTESSLEQLVSVIETRFDYIEDDFWTGYFFDRFGRSAKFSQVSNDLSRLIDQCRELKQLLRRGGRRSGIDKIDIELPLIQLQSLYRKSDSGKNYQPDWKSVRKTSRFVPGAPTAEIVSRLGGGDNKLSEYYRCVGVFRQRLDRMRAGIKELDQPAQVQ